MNANGIIFFTAVFANAPPPLPKKGGTLRVSKMLPIASITSLLPIITFIVKKASHLSFCVCLNDVNVIVQVMTHITILK